MTQLPKHFLISGFVFLSITVTTYSQSFTEVSSQSGLTGLSLSVVLIGGGCAFFDYDNDGWLDIYLSGGLRRDQLYHNNADGTFTEVGIQAGFGTTGSYYTMGVVTGDIDNDGYRDVFVTTLGIGQSFSSFVPNMLFHNNGNGTFTDISWQAGIRDSSWSVSATMGDFNLDGYLDIYVVNYVKTLDFILDSITGDVIGYNHKGFPNFLYLNNGNNTFSNVAAQMQVADNGTGLAAAFTDYDNDHDPDIHLVNDFGAWVIPDRLFRNEFPADSFTDASSFSGADVAFYGMGIAIGDYDEDDDLDYYVTNIGANALLNNNGNGTFTDLAPVAGVENTITDTAFTTSWGATFLDYDNDTWLDLLVANGYIPSAPFNPTAPDDPNKLFKNNGDGTFTDVSVLEGVSDSSINRGCVFGDYDNDGDLDLLVATIEDGNTVPNPYHVLLFRNDISNGNHWLKVRVQGTQSNRDGFGSRVEAYYNGRKWIREIDGGSSHASQNSSIAQFGLGSNTGVDSVVVIWPGGGRTVVANVTVDQTITIVQGGFSQVVNQRTVEICSSDSFFAGGAFQHINGTYYDTIISSVADTIIITDLTVHPIKVTSNQYSICEGDSILLAGHYRGRSGDYNDTLSTVFGCDSTIVNQLTVLPLLVAIADAVLCEGDSILAGGAWQKEGGNYYDTLPGTPCRQVVITSVDVLLPIPPDTIYAFLCAGDSLFIAGKWQTESGFYPDTIPAPFGCDTIKVTLLEEQDYQISYGNITITVGDSFFVAGAWQTEPGTYTDTLISTLGCDSIAITDLLVITGMPNISSDVPNLFVYPNPSHFGFTISYFTPQDEAVEIKAVSPSGKQMAILLNGKVPAGDHEINMWDANLPAGIYIITLKTSRDFKWVKVVML